MRNFARCASKSAVVSRHVFSDPRHRAYKTANTPPRIPAKDERHEDLPGTNPGADGRCQFQVSHSHAAEHAWKAEQDYSESDSGNAFSRSGEAPRDTADDETSYEKRHDQPVRHAPGPEVYTRCHDQNCHTGPPCD